MSLTAEVLALLIMLIITIPISNDAVIHLAISESPPQLVPLEAVMIDIDCNGIVPWRGKPMPPARSRRNGTCNPTS